MRRTLLALAALLAFSGPAQAAIDTAVLDSLQYRGFLYFWNEANPANGLVKDRNTPGSVSSIAVIGRQFREFHRTTHFAGFSTGS